MMIQATNLRNGQKIEYENDVWNILSYEHRTPGKGNACMIVKMRSLSSGVSKVVRFNSTERVPEADLDERRMGYSYHDGHDYVFMDNESYEQVALSDDQLGDVARWLVEGMVINVQYLKGKQIGISMPATIEMKIARTEPAVRGDTATSVTKAAELESGAEIQVPLFINTGDTVKVDTREGVYLERVRKG